MTTLVNAEQAKQLKEAGYDVPVNKYYAYTGKIFNLSNRFGYQPDMDLNHELGYEDCCSATTLHEAADWLREVKNIHVNTTPYSNGWSYSLWRILDNKRHSYISQEEYPPYDTHDTALSAGIAAALLIYKEQGK